MFHTNRLYLFTPQLIVTACLLLLLAGASSLGFASVANAQTDQATPAASSPPAPHQVYLPLLANGDSDALWSDAIQTPTVAQSDRLIIPQKYRAVTLNVSALQQLLQTTTQSATVVFSLPLPDGTMGRFRIVESPITAPELAAKFSKIKTYAGQGLDDPTATVRFDWTPTGFHAIILSATDTVFIAPYSRNDTVHYISYYQRDYQLPAVVKAAAVASAFVCPSTDLAGFPLDINFPSGDNIHCSYPVFPGDDPFDFYCLYSATTGVLVEDHDAGLCRPNAIPATDLTVSKTNDTSGNAQVGVAFHWTVGLLNNGSATATFSEGATILRDELPTSGATYDASLNISGGAITGNENCTITSNVVTCVATGGPVTIDPTGFLNVTITVNPTAAGTLTNPQSGGVCGVDPGSVVAESNEANNTCNTDTVTVTAAPQTLRQQVEAVRDSLASLLPTGDNKTNKSLEKAIAKLNQALVNDLWQGDGNYLTLKGEMFFHRVRDAVKELVKIKNPPATVTNAINTLVAISRELAQIALNEAIADSGNASKIAKAQNEMNKGDQDLNKGKYANAISHYEEAWEYAQEAVGNVVIAAVDEVEPSDEPEESDEHVHEEEAQINRLFLPMITSNTP